MLCQVQSLDEAMLAATCGADAIVVQGTEAGGHGRHNDGVEALLRRDEHRHVGRVRARARSRRDHDRRRRSACHRPGCCRRDGRHSVVCATGALDINAANQELAAAGVGDTARTTVFDKVRRPGWPDGYDGRALRNLLVARWEGSPAKIHEVLAAERARYRAEVEVADLSQRVVWGRHRRRSDRVRRPAATVIAELTGGVEPTQRRTGPTAER